MSLAGRISKDEEKKIESCVFLLSSPSMFEHYGREVTKAWKYSCEHYLTESSRNRRAYLGQASCFFYCGAPEFVTKKAWNSMSQKSQERANAIADVLIYRFLKGLGKKSQLSLFDI